MVTIKCSSSHVPITNDSGSARFPCPNCGKTEIIRSRRAREVVMKYTCPECGFEGPN
ncbi:MAG: zinc finger domain-containing protein [archaeon]